MVQARLNQKYGPNDALRRYGCFFYSLMYVAGKTINNPERELSYYNEAVRDGVMSKDCYVNDPVGLLYLFGYECRDFRIVTTGAEALNLAGEGLVPILCYSSEAKHAVPMVDFVVADCSYTVLAEPEHTIQIVDNDWYFWRHETGCRVSCIYMVRLQEEDDEH